MRDWDETFIKTVCIADTMDYITYEGLRHFRCEGKCWVYWKMGLHYLWGIETEDFWSSNPLPSIGLHYLWGIETNLSRLICPCGDINGLHYLWGIETSRVPPRAKKVQICAASDYITYERLRHNSCSIFNEVFWIVTGLHYLWEIETFLLMKVLLSLIYGLHYLWGIETFRKCLLHLLLTFAGLHYLRGIETYRILLLDFQ